MSKNEAKILKYLAGSDRFCPLPAWAKVESVRALEARKCIVANAELSGAYITDDGYMALSDYQDQRRERRWTRGLALAALILSIISVTIAGTTLFLQYLAR